MKLWKIGNMPVVRLNVSISKEQWNWIQEKHISATKFLRAKLTEEMKKG